MQYFIDTFGLLLEGICFLFFMESLKKGTLPVSLRRAGVTLLPKKGDLEDIRR